MQQPFDAGDKTVRLYDLIEDPAEKHNLAAAKPDEVKRLQAAWDAWNKDNIPPAWKNQRTGQERPRNGRNARRNTNTPPALDE
jgi:hypothetical protein